MSLKHYRLKGLSPVGEPSSPSRTALSKSIKCESPAFGSLVRKLDPIRECARRHGQTVQGWSFWSSMLTRRFKDNLPSFNPAEN